MDERICPVTTEKNLVSREERLHEILAMLETMPSAKTAEEAHGMVVQAFDAIEIPLLNAEVILTRMDVREFKKSLPLKYTDRTVYVYNYNNHSLVIRENGAFEMRSVSETISKITAPWFRGTVSLPTSLDKPYFEKANVNGSKVWDV